MATSFKALRREWENKLSDFGLSHKQLSAAKTQFINPLADDFCIAHDRRLTGFSWKKELAETMGFESHYGFSRVPIRQTTRIVPDWTVSDENIERFLLHCYPGLVRQIGKAYRYTPKQFEAARKAAGRKCRLLYLAYRAGWPNEDIAGELNVTAHCVDVSLTNVCRRAEKFFAAEERLAEKRLGRVLVHFCHQPSEEKPYRCRCKKLETPNVPGRWSTKVMRIGCGCFPTARKIRRFKRTAQSLWVAF